eukprot:TRINITY_DN14651_c0_g1_i1.p2 TRINITY_DN14651_c0_g1~~TRINITY_DN14651_c0_g1_i1.p2  ORF type:complete len:221 (+),score=56.09 TRINITY_DN14651_c0_g1_i1:79-741(+)
MMVTVLAMSPSARPTEVDSSTTVPPSMRLQKGRRMRLQVFAAAALAAIATTSSAGRGFAVLPSIRGGVGEGVQGHTKAMGASRSLQSRRSKVGMKVDGIADTTDFQNPLGQLFQVPEGVDQIAKAFAYGPGLAFPVIVLASWGYMTYATYQEAQEDRENYEKEKLRKALKYDPDVDKELDRREERELRRQKRRGKSSALKEIIAMEKEEKRKARTSGIEF